MYIVENGNRIAQIIFQKNENVCFLEDTLGFTSERGVKAFGSSNLMKFESTSELQKELTNILLLATEVSNFFYCYCEKNGRKCDLCDLYHY